MAFPSYRSKVETGVTASSNTVSVAAPAGVISGDYQLVILSISSGSVALPTTDPTGWTLLSNDQVSSATSPDRGGTHRIAVYESTTATGAFAATLTGTARIWAAVRLAWSLPAGGGRTVAIAKTIEATGVVTTTKALPAVTAGAVESLAIGIGVADYPSSNPWTGTGTYTQRSLYVGASASESQSFGVGDLQVAASTAGVTGNFTITTGDEVALYQVILNGTAAANPVPAVSAGADATIALGATFTRTATETDNGSAITARAWTVVSGPAQVGTTLATTAALSWTPGTAGTYVLGYTATNANGTSPRDDVTVTVTGPVRTLDQAWLGLDAIAVKTTTNISADTARVAFSTSSGMTSPVYSASLVTPDANGISKHAVPALTADTAYWYQVELGGALIGTAQPFRTLPAVGVQSFTFAFSSCRDHVDNFPSVNPTALADAVTRGIDFFLQCGDFHYRDISTNDQAAFRTAYDEFYTRSNIAALLRGTPTGYVWDDHDYGGDNSNGTTASRPAAQAVYRERVPHPTLPSATGGIYHSWVIGRVRFIMLDCRSFRSPNGNTDNSSKTMLGAEQKTWLQALLNNATTPLTVIVSSVGWVGGADSAQDHWGNYQTERTEVGGWITANAATTKCVFLSGDAHMLAYDNGTNSVAGVPQYHAAALNQTTSTKGGPYSGGSRASSNAYGYVSVVDSGSQIDFTYSGYYDGGTLWASNTTTVLTGTTHSRALADTVGITDAAAQATTAARGVTDAVGLTDSPAASATTSRAVADTIGVTDSPSTAATTSRAVADTVGLSDATAAGYELTRTVADSIGITDQTTTQVDAVISRTLADTIGVSDAVTRSGASSRTVADTVGITDQSTRTHTAARALADGIGLADATTLEVATPPPTPGGLAAVLYLIDKATGGRTPLTGWTKLSLSPIDNAVGALVVTCASGAPGFSALHDGIVAAENRDVLVELRIFNADGRIRRYRGFLQQKEGDDLTRGASWAFTGAVVEQLLAETLVYPGTGPGYNDKKELQFSGVSPGTVLITAAQQSQGRGGLPGVTWDFTTTHDSNGAVWASTLTNLAFSPTTTVLALAQKLVELQTVDFVLTEDFVLRAFNSDTRGVDRSTGGTPLRFSEVANLIGRGSRRESSRTPDSGTAVLAKGKEGFYGQAADAAALANRGRRVEVPVDAGDIATDAGVTAAAQAHMQIKKTGKASYEYNVAIGAGRPAPGFDFDTGDYAQALVGQKFARRKISQWVLEFERGKAPACTVALNDLIPDPLVKLARALAAIGNGGAVVGTSTGGAEPDTTVPAPPTGVVASSLAYLEGPYSLAAVTIGWTPTEQNTDGSPYEDVGGYRVELQYATNPTQWIQVADMTGEQSQWTGDATPGAILTARVSTYDTSGHFSDWATLAAPHTVALDDIPPDTPSTPTAVDYLGTLICRWDGMTSTGGPMPLDLAYVEVHMSTSSVFAPEAPTPTALGATCQGELKGPGPFAVSDLPYDGAARFFRLVAVDAAGNRSEPSASSGGATPAQVVSADVFAGAIGTAQLAGLAVTTAKINLLAVNDAQVGNLNVGKLVSGTSTAAIQNAGIITAGTPGAGRTENDSAGFRVYNPSNVQIVGFGTNGYNFMTGEMRTALSGSRIVLNPAGTDPDRMEFFPSGAGSRASITSTTAPADGSAAILIDGGAGSGNGRGRFGAYFSEAFVSYASSATGFSRTAVSCNNNNINIWTPQGGSGDIKIQRTNGSNITPLSQQELRLTTQSGSGGTCPVVLGFGQDAGVKFDDHFILMVNTAGDFQNAKALAFVNTSTEEAKTDVTDIRAVLSPREVIRAARAKAWKLTREVEDPEIEAPTRFGPIAEELPPELVVYSPKADGSGLEGSVSLGDQIGALWGWANQIDDQRLVHTSASVKPPALTLPNADVDVTVTWDEGPAQTVPAVVSLVPIGPGPLQQRAITARVVDVTTAGVTVRFRTKRALTGATVLDPEDRYVVNALFLFTPPYTPPAAA